MSAYPHEPLFGNLPTACRFLLHPGVPQGADAVERLY